MGILHFSTEFLLHQLDILYQEIVYYFPNMIRILDAKYYHNHKIELNLNKKQQCKFQLLVQDT